MNYVIKSSTYEKYISDIQEKYARREAQDKNAVENAKCSCKYAKQNEKYNTSSADETWEAVKMIIIFGLIAEAIAYFGVQDSQLVTLVALIIGVLLFYHLIFKPIIGMLKPNKGVSQAALSVSKATRTQKKNQKSVQTNLSAELNVANTDYKNYLKQTEQYSAQYLQNDRNALIFKVLAKAINTGFSKEENGIHVDSITTHLIFTVMENKVDYTYKHEKQNASYYEAKVGMWTETFDFEKNLFQALQGETQTAGMADALVKRLGQAFGQKYPGSYVEAERDDNQVKMTFTKVNREAMRLKMLNK